MEDEPAAPAEPEKEKDVEEILKGFKGIPGELNVRVRDKANPNPNPNPNPDPNRYSNPA